MIRKRRVLLGGVLLVAIAAGAGSWLLSEREPVLHWQERPVRATAGWPQRALDKLGAKSDALSSVDRIHVHLLSHENIWARVSGSDEPGTIGLGSLQGRELEARNARQHEQGRILRRTSPQPLFPLAPAAEPVRAILKTVTLEGAAAKELLDLWRAQTMDCDPPGGFPLCNEPDFAVSLLAGQQPVLEFSLCWWCQAAWFYLGAQGTECDFAVGIPAARSLRRALKGYFPGAASSEDRVLPSAMR